MSGASVFNSTPGPFTGTESGACIQLEFVKASVISNCQFGSSNYGIFTIDCGGSNHFINNSFSGVAIAMSIIEQGVGVLEDVSWAPTTN